MMNRNGTPSFPPSPLGSSQTLTKEGARKGLAVLTGQKGIIERYTLKANPKDKELDPLSEAAKATSLLLALNQAGPSAFGVSPWR